MKADVCREFGLVKSTIQMFCKKHIEITSVFEQNGSRTKRLPNTERRDDDEALFKWFKQYRSETVPFSSLLMVTFVLPKF